jgi:hypothetical protein
MLSQAGYLFIVVRGVEAFDLRFVATRHLGFVVRALRYDNRNAGFLNLNFGVVTNLDDCIVIAHAGDLAENAACCKHFVTGLQSGHQFCVCLLLFLLRPDEQEIESSEHQNHHYDEAGGTTFRSGTLCVGVLNKEIHSRHIFD